MFVFRGQSQHSVTSMKMISNRISFLRSRMGRIVACAAGFVLVSAALAWSINYAKSGVRRQATSGAAGVSTNANRTVVPAARAFGVDQTCTINCGATVPAAGTVNTSVNFQGTATATGCATVPTFEWNFGDGSAASTQQNPSKTYTAGGTYNWTLTTRAGSGATGIDTIVGGYGEGNPALLSPFGVILSVARDPLGRGLFVVDRLNDTSYIRFINTTAAPVTLAGKTIPAGANRFLAGGGLDPLGDNVRGSLSDLGNVSGLGVKPDGNLLYFANSLDAIIRVLNIGSTVTTIGSGNVDVGNVRTFPVSGLTFGVNLGQLTVTPGGDLYVCDATPGVHKIFLITATGVGSTFAGNGATTQETLAFAPGLATNTPLITPRAVEVNGADVYIADTGHGRVIKVTGGNATLVSQFSIGSGQSRITVAPFDIPPFPAGLAWFSGGLYIAMGNSQNVVRMNGSTPTIVSGAKFVSCEYSTTNCGDGGAIGSMQFSFNGSSSTAQQPIVGMVADANGIYVADQATPNRARVRFLNFGNSTVSVNGLSISANNGDTIAGNGALLPFNNGLASSAGLVSPSGVALDPNGNLYLAERTGGRVRFVNRSASPVTLFAGTDSAQTVQPGRIITVNRDFNTGNTAIEGPVIRTTMDNPQGLFATANGLYVVDSQGGPSVKTNPSDPAVTFNKTRTSLIRFFNTSGANVTFYPNANSPIVIAPGNIGTIAGGGTSSPSIAPEGFALNMVMAAATDIVVAADGTMYIADVGNKKVRKIAPMTGTSSSLTLPTGAKQYVGLSFDTAGRLYVTNFDDSQLLRESAAGSGSFARMDGGGLNSPRDVAVDGDGNAFVANSQVSTAAPGANANQIVRVAAAGGAATKIAGGATSGFSGDGGLAANALLNVSPSNPVYTAGQPQKNAPTLTGMVREAASGQIIFADTFNERLRVLSAAVSTCTQTGSIMIAGSNPLPTLSGISPNTALVGAGAQTLTLTGSGFVPSSLVRWNGADRTTTFVSGTSLTAQIPASDITSAGTAQVTVFNAAPGGGTSGAQSFTITAPNQVPTLTSLSPNSAAEGSPAFTLTVNGANFVNGSVVRWDSSARPTTFVSATQLTAQIPASDLAGGAGTAQVTVFNPAPGGGTSSALSFTITTFNPSPTISGLNPGQANAGGAAFTLTVNGSSFVPSSVVRWNGSDRATMFVNATQVTAQITAADIANVGSAAITVFTPTPGGGVSGTLNFSITQGPNPSPTLTSINPTTTPSGGTAFTLTLTGTNFINASLVRWNGADRTTTFDSATQLRAQITANDIANAGSVQVTVFNPASSGGGGGGGTSSAQTFTITQAPNPAPVLTSISPSSVIAGSAAQTVTLTGTGFIPASMARVNGNNWQTAFINSTTLTIQLAASDVASPASLAITVVNPAPGGGTSGAQTLTVSNNNPTPTLTSLNPTNVGSGGAAFTLTVNGTNFVSGAVVRLNGTDRMTTFVSSTQVTAAILSNDIAAPGQATITVFNPASPSGGGGGLSNSLTLNIVTPNPVPVITSLSPNPVTAGGPAFTLTITGTGFVSPSAVSFNGANRVATFVNNTTLTIQVAANEIASAGTANITVTNPPSAGGGGGASNALTLTIITVSNPAPVLTGISPSSVMAGSAALTVTLTGTGFIPASMARVNGNNWQTAFVNSTTLTIQLAASNIASAASLAITVFNPAPGGGTSGAQTLSVSANNPTPTLTSVSPNSVTAGSATFILTATGTNFINGSVIRWNGMDRPTTFVSSTQLTAQISAADVASASSVAVTVFNPAPGGGASNAVNVNIVQANPLPTVTALSPNAAVAGGAGFALTITGTGFMSSSTVRWNGSDRLTDFLSATSLRINVTASDIANVGTATIAVFNPAPGGGLSGALNFTVQSGNQVPTLSSLNPATVNVGGGNLLLTVTGTNFVNASVVRWNGLDRPTTFVSATQLTAQIPAGDIATAATVAISVFSPAPGGGTSNALSLSIVQPANPSPTITNLDPPNMPRGGAAFTLTVTGTNFIPASVVRWNNQNRATTYVSATQLTATITATDLANVGTVPVTVFNPAPGGGTSSVLNFSITQAPNSVPVITAISPNPATVGGTAFILNVTGTGFIEGSIVRINSAERVTTFVNSTTLTARMLASDVANVGTSAITVFNPASTGGGGGVSNPVSLTIGNPSPSPTLTQLSTTLVTTGTAPFSLTVTGTGFIPASQLRVNGADRLTAYISPTMLTMDIGVNELAAPGNLVITVVNPLPGGGTSNALVLTVASVTTSVSAASYADNLTVAPDSIVAAFGVNLATSTLVATSVPLPTTLNGTTVRIRDAAGNERLAPLFFVAANQVNYLLPSGLVNGAATVTITSGDRRIAIGRLQIARVEPGLFSANATGTGVMSALALRIRANGELVYEELARFNAATATFVPVPLDLGPATDRVFLVAFGTGFRNRNELASATATLGNTNLPVLYAGAQGELAGLDQLNVGEIPRSLVGAGAVNLTLRVEGKQANVVSVTIR